MNFREVYEAEFSYVWRSLERLGVAERDRTDAAHDVFVAFYRKMSDYDRSRPLRPWLYSFVARAASDYRRLARHRRELSSDSVGDLPDPAPPADQRVASAEARALVEEAMDALAMPVRAVFVMHEIEGHPIPHIARALRIPENTAYSRLRLAREQLQAEVRRLRLRKGTP